MAEPAVSIVFVTHREEPRFDWFADSLARQLAAVDDLEVVFVDGLHGPERAQALEAVVAGRFPFRHVPPKPNPWNGPHRLTGRDCWAVSSARNTGIVVSRGRYLAFADDSAVLAPTWLGEVRAAARHGYVVAGAYEKRREMVVEDGVLVAPAGETIGHDVRWERGADGIAEISGGELFGCSFGAPRELLVRVNGLDELCDPLGSEDCQLGLRLEFAGVRIFYSRAMLTVETEGWAPHEQAPRRIGRKLDPDAYMATLRRFGVAARSTSGPTDNGHMILDVTYGTRSVRSLGNYYDLASLTEAGLAETIERFPREYWFDGTPLEEFA